MRDHDDLPYILIEHRSAGIGPFVWGALIGAGAALLLAPRSGAQTQEEIRESVRRVRAAAEDRVDAVKNSVTQTRDRIEGRVEGVRDHIGSARGKFEHRAEQARDALETGRRAAREAREELERRVADVKESYQSVADKIGRHDRADPEAGGADVIVTDISEERTDGRSDLG